MKKYKIPKYPNFKKVEISDKSQIDSIVKSFSPYCDYNFSNIYNWSDLEFPTDSSLLGDSLILRMRDFTTCQTITSFIGKDFGGMVAKTLAKDFGKLTLVPDCVFLDKTPVFSNLEIIEDRNNFDYILSLNEMASLQGIKYKQKRKFIHRFLKKNPTHKVVLLNLTKKSDMKKLDMLLSTWRVLKGISDKESEREFVALKRLIDNIKIYNMVIVGILINDNLIGFTTNELNRNYAMGGFGKADFTFDGIYDYLEHATAKVLLKYGCKYLNYEQDLGIPGLRLHKMSWHPIKFLRKYVISSK